MDHLHAALYILRDLIYFGMAMALTWYGICLIVERLLNLSNGLFAGTLVWAFLWAAAFAYHDAYVVPVTYMGMQ